MTKLAIIGGTGFTSIDELEIVDEQTVDTPYGSPSSALIKGNLSGKEVVFLARHGVEHTIPPHKINYRANIWALKSIGITDIIAVAAVGGIHKDIPPEKIIIPDQIIDYTHDRKHTYFEDNLSEVTHIDFTHPYSEKLRQLLHTAAKNAGIDIFNGGTYAVTQGPRLETAAEISRLEKDGCDIVGMTGMPEAALAKELGLGYACCALSVNWAAGVDNKDITMEEINTVVKKGVVVLRQILVATILKT